MTDSKDTASLVEDLKTTRDELKLKAHLFEMDMKNEWADLEKKWDGLDLNLDDASDAAKESAGNVGAAASLLIEELGKGYKKIKAAL
ncbi:hypothetical protein DS909_13040 [Phaeobacter gallaeciensis]|uniref:Coiled coil domain-containing protein n=2 Tax=Roseobacteraceae TaxID=2854170 RepID=A0A366WXY6_9RHOB|nr:MULTISPECIES: hypothetical protein [Roseobacteraceae]MBT3142088.1 hypothetical protein [Falsiruegeria litorea]MBT8168566.1 hypothetical protein [Falsiruegeria litorea]RBW53957.1 hypothetical protein DS909_13040 [Phaeobacter gallaeciensis]